MTGAGAAAEPPPNRQYRVQGPANAQQRSAVASTGAAIDEGAAGRAAAALPAPQRPGAGGRRRAHARGGTGAGVTKASLLPPATEAEVSAIRTLGYRVAEVSRPLST